MNNVAIKLISIIVEIERAKAKIGGRQDITTLWMR
jgi:hypothetical protein